MAISYFNFDSLSISQFYSYKALIHDINSWHRAKMMSWELSCISNHFCANQEKPISVSPWSAHLGKHGLTKVRLKSVFLICAKMVKRYSLGAILKSHPQNFRDFGPLPLFVMHSRNLSVVFVTYWVTPLPPQCGRHISIAPWRNIERLNHRYPITTDRTFYC